MAIEQELADNLLNPRRPGLRISRDDDVAISKLKFVPDGRVHMMVLALTRLARPFGVGGGELLTVAHREVRSHI